MPSKDPPIMGFFGGKKVPSIKYNFSYKNRLSFHIN